MADGSVDPKEKKNAAMIGLASHQPTSIGSPLVPSPKPLQNAELGNPMNSTPTASATDKEVEKPTIKGEA